MIAIKTAGDFTVFSSGSDEPWKVYSGNVCVAQFWAWRDVEAFLAKQA